ncbi:MAG: hypothetical protein GX992_00590 [Clostridium sp.]|nr:hypothetical protein [Clostridium sp.]
MTIKIKTPDQSPPKTTTKTEVMGWNSGRQANIKVMVDRSNTRRGDF